MDNRNHLSDCQTMLTEQKQKGREYSENCSRKIIEIREI